MKHAFKTDPTFSNPTLAELAWVGAQKAARLVKAIMRSAIRSRRATDRPASGAGPNHVRLTTGAPWRHRASQLTLSLKALWRRPAFAAALAGTAALTFPLALLAGGDTHTFALWHDSETADSAVIVAGNLDAVDGGWVRWSSDDRWGTCLKPPNPSRPTECADYTDQNRSTPLSAFVAAQGDQVELVGEFGSVLEGDNIAAILNVEWASASNPSGVTATYTVAAKETDGPDADLTPVTDSPLGLGEDLRVVAVSDDDYLDQGGDDAVVLPGGIYEASAITWQVVVTIEFESGSWIDPLDPPGGDATEFVIPDVTFTLEQVRAGEGWGVPIQ
ncbi:MAG: SipW-dependent-type signal peptide-containing protein [Bifidobacteriaceae bacterium]|nr:SipW-dependent-type signal peptide-containing protein [Bifidobacteriaceae bacterium]